MIRFPAGFDGGDRIKRYLDYYQPSYGVMMLSKGQFSPLSLFAAGEQGVWYDPSDFSTMFQDSAGTTPVTAVEQPVGRILDKSGRGNTATQAISANRPVLSARVNLLVGTATLATQSVTTVATTYILSFSGAGSITLSGTATGVYTAGSNTITCTAGTLTLTVSGSVTAADIRAATDGIGIPTYQRVTTSTDYDTTGFPYYLFFDGSNDLLRATFTITQPFTRFSGLRVLTDMNNKQLFGGVTNNAGVLYGFLTTNLNIFSGTIVTGPAVSIPNTYVAQEVHSGASSSLRINGGTAVSGNAGTTLPGGITIGASNLSASWINTRIYSVIEIQRLLTATEIANTQTWVNNVAKAY